MALQSLLGATPRQGSFRLRESNQIDKKIGVYLGRVDDEVECLASGLEFGTGPGWLQLEREE